jgi:hypothetical protein
MWLQSPSLPHMGQIPCSLFLITPFGHSTTMQTGFKYSNLEFNDQLLCLYGLFHALWSVFNKSGSVECSAYM